MHLDTFDRRILDILQADCMRSHAAIGREVGLSGSAVRRRIQAMRASGVIAREVAILGEGVAGLTVVVTVELDRETKDVYDALRDSMCADDHVLQCYFTAGQLDIVLIVAVSSPEDYKAWAERTLLGNPSVRRFESFFAWSTAKSTTKRPSSCG
ncbi:MAG: Lrp/AsnC family transcriptional regulator [Hyphomonadaceae bacterium]|nr:Lrp/AsnC family transcriptional regulator [Hyphomonadaceae bacterium]GIK50844.1 MAG: AsnC family transcriptional regulator [Alphaproteobacteria bacterium]